ncbi:uncharacterized protein Dana_GF15717 [Drosophila ananassae]|uniref:Uncharacterized protein n=1 Tax=Drosophila ananassae TaxID=7217 RepID=B3MP91_DROAN|nr:uncharacterized protein LOC6498522 [Drosophila ananassae]EDV32210.1 uncharacterized protein Dana_GF15717 [Drosophila ananassae]KAH8319168.1 hypothetical protein KR067_011830 [Drosophila pandora]
MSEGVVGTKESLNLNSELPLPPAVSQSSSVSLNTATSAATAAASCPPTANVVTIPVPILQSEGNFAYITVKGSLHDYTCTVFGLNQAEIQALSKRFESVKPCVNGIMVAVPPMVMLNTLAQLSYKVTCSCGEAEICWTMQREV